MEERVNIVVQLEPTGPRPMLHVEWKLSVPFEERRRLEAEMEERCKLLLPEIIEETTMKLFKKKCGGGRGK